MGIVYVLSNEAMPGIVKIGMTDDIDANERIGQLYTTGVPLPFEIKYACHADSPREVEEALHVAFGPYRINPRREFFRIKEEQAIAILRVLNRNKPDITAEIVKEPTGVDAESLAAIADIKRRRPSLDFVEMGIPIGARLDSVSPSGVTVLVSGPKKVKLGEEELSLTAATQKGFRLEKAVWPTPHWKYEGRPLLDIYEETYTRTDG